jgi:hypothetical protein
MNLYEATMNAAAEVSSGEDFYDLANKIHDLLVEEKPSFGLALIVATQTAISVAKHKVGMSEDDVRSFFSEALDDYLRWEQEQRLRLVN